MTPFWLLAQHNNINTLVWSSFSTIKKVRTMTLVGKNTLSAVLILGSRAAFMWSTGISFVPFFALPKTGLFTLITANWQKNELAFRTLGNGYQARFQLQECKYETARI